MDLRLDEITLAKNYSRTFGIGDISELAHSMQEHGQITAISVTPDHSLVAGFRRYHAAQELGWEYIRAEVTTGEPGVVNLIENMNREGLTLWEEIQGIRDVFGPEAKQADICRSLSKSKTWVRPRINVWSLPKDFVDEVRLGRRGIKDIAKELRKSKAGRDQSVVKAFPKPDEIKQVITQLLQANRTTEALALSYAVGGVSRESLLNT